MDKIKELIKVLPFDDVELVNDSGSGNFEINIFEGDDDGNLDLVSLFATKEDTSQIDNLIELLEIYKSKILNSGGWWSC